MAHEPTHPDRRNAGDPSPITLVQYGGLTPGTTMSAPCGKVHMVLRFKNLDYEIKNLRLPSQVKRYSPRGRVPVILLDGRTIVDSTDIVAELDKRYPDPPLLPAEPASRAQVKILEDWADEVIYFYLVYLRWIAPENFARMKSEVLGRLPVPLRWIAPRIAVSTVRKRVLGQGVGLKDEATVRRELRECLEAVRDLLQGRSFLVGEGITLADLAVCAALDQVNLSRLTPGPAADLNELPEILSWIDRVHQRAPGAAA